MSGFGAIDKVGAEIECGALHGDRVTGCNTQYDGSVHSRHNSVEYTTKPCSTQESFEEIINRLYEQEVREVNTSMGLHIHISLKNEVDYFRLTSMAFYKFFVDELTKSELYRNNERLRTRLANNQYCSKLENKDTIDAQIKTTEKGRIRYRVINFCKNVHGTIEFRVFPAVETAAEVFQALKIVVDSVNTYLSEPAKPMTFHLHFSDERRINMHEKVPDMNREVVI